MKKKICLVTGGFDPVHSGHIEYINSAKKYSDYVVVGINSNEWLERKKQLYLMPWQERATVIQNLKSVDQVISFDDSDGSAINAIHECLKFSKEVIFANGGDRSSVNTPELLAFTEDKRVEFIYGVGGEDKKNSSSWLLSDFTDKYMLTVLPSGLSDITTVNAPWGSHTAFLDDQGYKVKQLKVKPGGILSLQKHQHRMEHWVVGSGTATVELDGDTLILQAGEYIHIPLQSSHRLSNNTAVELIVLEVQCGDILEESDIIRLEDNYGRTS
jgi:cytidyltransferase-like protein